MRAVAADGTVGFSTDVFLAPLLGFTVSGDSYPAPGQPREQWLGRFNYGFTQHLGPKFSLSYLHLNFDSTLGRVTTASGAYLYPGNGFQMQDTLSAGYAVSRTTTLVAGWFSKSQQCCPASSVNNVAYRGPYVESDFAFGKGSDLGPQWFASLTAIYVLRNAASETDRSTFMGNVGLTFTQPIDRGKTFGAFVTYLYGNDYFDGSPVVTPSNAVLTGLLKTAGPHLTFGATYKSFQAFKSGTPFPGSNTVHFDTLTLSATLHYHLTP
jgi:hypothetical protein